MVRIVSFLKFFNRWVLAGFEPTIFVFGGGCRATRPHWQGCSRAMCFHLRPTSFHFFSFQVWSTVSSVGHRAVGPRRRVAAAERSVDAKGHRAKRDPAKPKIRTLLPAQVPHGKLLYMFRKLCRSSVVALVTQQPFSPISIKYLASPKASNPNRSSLAVTQLLDTGRSY